MTQKIDYIKSFVSFIGLAASLTIVFSFSRSIFQVLIGLAIVFGMMVAHTLFVLKYKSRHFTVLILNAGKGREYDELPLGDSMARGLCEYKGVQFNIRIGVSPEGIYLYKYGCFCRMLKWNDIENIAGNENRRMISIVVGGVQENFSIPWKERFSKYSPNR